MSETSLATTTEQPLTTQQRAAKTKSKALKVTGKLKVAIDAMVWEGLDYADAGRKAELTAYAIRSALSRPHVLAYQREQLQVLRSSEYARNIRRAVEIRDAANNMPAIHAIRYLDGENADNTSGINGMHRSPGMTVVVVQTAPLIAPQRQIDDKPLIEHEDVRNER